MKERSSMRQDQPRGAMDNIPLETFSFRDTCHRKIRLQRLGTLFRVLKKHSSQHG